MGTTLYTIGFTKSSAEHFFTRLRSAGIRRLIDVRLHNTNTLAGFTKRDDLAFFLRTVWNLDVEYVHEPLLAPTKELLKAYQAKQVGWDQYVAQYEGVIREREVATKLDRALFKGPSVLLCSEAAAERCHRRLIAEHLAQAWGGLQIVHL